jgi:hypothetical protein
MTDRIGIEFSGEDIGTLRDWASTLSKELVPILGGAAVP